MHKYVRMCVCPYARTCMLTGMHACVRVCAAMFMCVYHACTE